MHLLQASVVLCGLRSPAQRCRPPPAPPGAAWTHRCARPQQTRTAEAAPARCHGSLLVERRWEQMGGWGGVGWDGCWDHPWAGGWEHGQQGPAALLQTAAETAVNPYAQPLHTRLHCLHLLSNPLPRPPAAKQGSSTGRSVVGVSHTSRSSGRCTYCAAGSRATST